MSPEVSERFLIYPSGRFSMFGCGIRPSGHSSICREAVTGRRMATAFKLQERFPLLVVVLQPFPAQAAGRTQVLAVPASVIAMRAVVAAEAEFRSVQLHQVRPFRAETMCRLM